MKRHWLTTGLTLVLLAVTGCGESAGPKNESTQPDPFEIEGAWLYLGPSDGPHRLTITRSSMVYADVDGKWSSSWTIQAHDNALRRFQVTFDSGSGAYLPAGQILSGSYEVSGTLLTTQLADGTAYPPLQSPGACTDGSASGTPVPNCRLYLRQ